VSLPIVATLVKKRWEVEVADQYAFGSFLLDDHERRLTQDGQDIHLQPRTFDVLRYLLEHAGKLVSKQRYRSQVIDLSLPLRCVTKQQALRQYE
jgi:DNA-binding response OmpR family regulator